MKINRLRLLGFKSFVEPTELVIESGLTGVLGPNGCGKSNLLEALRWVMGETSYKSMRASSMEDVIFAGTDKRPQRNSAEVTMFLDNSARKAPAEFNDSDSIEITRRIERDMGSAYRINGREARARDVKLLFEDAATGARSPALVRQGQIGEIVNAKPEQRRRILEDAAGIAGLHSRRHEAELRLRQAENNMERLQDVIGQLNSQVESLKRQARQARRYKDLSGEIRKAEAIHQHLLWQEIQALVSSEEAALGEALRTLGLATQGEAAALREETQRSEALQPLRDDEAVRGAILHRIKIEQENFEKEAQRIVDRQSEQSARAEQLERDIEREQRLIEEAREAMARLDHELQTLENEEKLSAEFGSQAETELVAVEQSLSISEAGLDELNMRVADDRAQRNALEQSKAERTEVLARLEHQLSALEAQTREIAARAPDITKVTAAQAAGQELARQISEIEVQTQAAEEQSQAAAAEAHESREASTKANLAASRLKTEVETLQKLLRPDSDADFPPIVDQLDVAPGYEMALGAALGDDLDAPASDEAPVRWQTLDVAAGGAAAGAAALPAGDAALPAGADPLLNYVGGAVELTRRLAQIGVVSRQDGDIMQPRLRPGQRLVSREGDLWRWDGFVAAAHAPTAAAKRLAERNRLGELHGQEQAASNNAAILAATAAQAAEAHAAAQEGERALRASWRDTQNRLAAARQALTEAEAAARETETRLANVSEAKNRLTDNLEEAHDRFMTVEAALNALPAADGLVEERDAAQSKTEELRMTMSQARANITALEREKKIRSERRQAIVADQERWRKRSSEAMAQIEAQNKRRADIESELAGLAELPAQIDGRRQALLGELSQAEIERKAAADKLAEAENACRDVQQALRAAQALVANEREQRARLEVRLENARARRSEQARAIEEALGCAPDACLAAGGVASEDDLPPLDDVERKLAKLKSDRERLGGVNLAADDELERLAGDYQSMEDERLDLEQAVAKLHGAIAQLNNDGRKRLVEAFEQVNEHFKRLFGALFSGGEARLELIEGDDPLESGLEIIARPPGKKPATLSLLSGGEQTLTALSLIFAVFLTNPSPICVLDEVDAPLDDANVDRFCSMMERMAAETDTRFLVITHHPMTMARMNRLFGVTMGEKGVSQLVSVDLATAERIVDAA